jgi:dethiobiotin synthetase
MTKGLFVTGTGTDVGKTYVTGLILKALHDQGLSAAYYKAAMSGNERGADGSLLPGDALQVKALSGISQSVEEMCPYVYEAAVSPHLAAQWEGDPVDLDVVRAGFQAAAQAYDYVTMEGSGGILCPIRKEGETVLWLPEVIKACGLGCLLVADAGLGTINAVGLTAHYLAAQGIPLKGIVFNHWVPGDRMQEDNLVLCQQLTGVPVVARVKEGDTDLDLSPARLQSLYDVI